MSASSIWLPSKSLLPADVIAILNKGVRSGLKSDKLDLDSKNLDDTMISEICEWIIKLGDKINQITSVGASMLFDTLKTKNIYLKVISLNGNKQIDDKCMKSLGEYIKSNKALETIWLSDISISDAGIEMLAPYIDGNTTFKELHMNFDKSITDKSIPCLIKMIESSCIEGIDIYKTSITQKSVIYTLSAWNKVKNGSTSLDLRGIKLNDDDLTKLCDAMKKHGIDKLKEIYLNNNRITSKGASVLFDTLKECNSVVSYLNLSENPIDDECVKQLGEYLQESEYIELLKLGYNNITDKGIEILSEYLIGNTTLKELDLSGNRGITSVSVPLLTDVAKRSSITKMDTSKISISKEKQKAINEALTIPIDQRDVNFDKKYVLVRKKQQEESEKRKEKLDYFLTSPEFKDSLIETDVETMINSQITPFVDDLQRIKENLKSDMVIYETELCIKRVKSTFEFMRSNPDKVKINHIQEQLRTVAKQSEIVENLENKIIKKYLFKSIEELKQKGVERDKERNTLIENFNLIKISVEKWKKIVLILLNKGEWKRIHNFIENIVLLKQGLQSEITYGDPLAQQQLHFLELCQLSLETKLTGDLVVDGNEMLQRMIELMNGMNSFSNMMIKTLISINKILGENILEMENNAKALIKGKQDFEEELNRMILMLDQQESQMEKEFSKYTRRKRIETLEKEIEKKEEETRLQTIIMNETAADLARRKKSLSPKEKDDLEKRVKYAEKGIKNLNQEHEDLIEALIEECNDESGNCIFPDIVKQYSSQLDPPSPVSPSNDLIQIPTILKMKSNRCHLLERIGDGAFSSVFKIKTKKRGYESDEEAFAFKQFNVSTNMIDASEIRIIEREVEILSRLRHDNIVKIIGAIGDPNAKDINNQNMGIGIVMEYCENGSLRSLLNKNTNQQQLLKMDLIVHLLHGAAQGLEYLHNHIPHAIVHGDIKSDNILVDKEYNAKLCDFGISKLQQTSTACSRGGGNANGTLAYKAPESFASKLECASDVYSFGCVILEMLTGDRPWKSLGNDIGAIVTKVLVTKEQHDLSKIRKDAKVELVDLMKKCFDYDKDKRPTMNEVRTELEMMMNNAVLIELDNISDEYNKVENMFFPGGDKEGSLNRKNYRIVKIDKVTNRFAETRYNTELSNMKSIMLQGTASVSAVSSSDKSIADVNEKLLFHGTRGTDPMIILNHPDAFMKDYSYAGFYGRGLYFAELARYSNAGYRYNIPNTNQHQMFICSVICGNPKEYGTTTNGQLAQKDLGTKYHSVHAGSHGIEPNTSCMYVVYKDIQVAARYIITYESKQ